MFGPLSSSLPFKRYILQNLFSEVLLYSIFLVFPPSFPEVYLPVPVLCILSSFYWSAFPCSKASWQGKRGTQGHGICFFFSFYSQCFLALLAFYSSNTESMILHRDFIFLELLCIVSWRDWAKRLGTKLLSLSLAALKTSKNARFHVKIAISNLPVVWLTTYTTDGSHI